MRGFTGLLLVPALVSGHVIRDLDNDVRDWGTEDIVPVTVDSNHLIADISVEIPGSPDWETQTLGFKLEVFGSKEACGYGNATVNGESLSQDLDRDISSGGGEVLTASNSLAVSSWSFTCINVNGVPDAQLMKFYVNFFDGQALNDVGFSALFRQSGLPEILTVNTDMSIPDTVLANPNPEVFRFDEEESSEGWHDIEDDLAELEYLHAQMKELKYLIAEKKRDIHHRMGRQEITDCDSLACVANAVVGEARYAAQLLVGKLNGEEGEFREWPKPPFKKSHFPHFHPPKGGKNHTCHGPKHGNHTRGNHTGPPHWKKPHFPHPKLPICRYPPPPHHKKPHHPPPPPHHGEHPPPPPPEFDQPPPHRGHGPPPDFDDEPPRHRKGGPKHGHPQGPDSNREEDDFGTRGPPPRGPPRGPPQHFNPFLQTLKFGIIGFLLVSFSVALHRRCCTPASRASRRSRRHQRRLRRANRKRSKFGRFLYQLFGGRIEYDDKDRPLLDNSSDDEESSMEQEITNFRNAADVVGEMVAAEADHQSSSNMAPLPSEPLPTHPVMVSVPITQVSTTLPIPITQGSRRSFDLSSQIGDGEELPAYQYDNAVYAGVEDDEDSEISSMIADGGFGGVGHRYTPSVSSAGTGTGLDDVLGPDTKN